VFEEEEWSKPVLNYDVTPLMKLHPLRCKLWYLHCHQTEFLPAKKICSAWHITRL